MTYLFIRRLSQNIYITFNLVLDKLTSAGFTVNAAECQFCKPEIKFLGHIISDEGVKADRERSEAILRYPVPKIQRQLRKFLGICNFHQHFILNYSSYGEPLLILLRKGKVAMDRCLTTSIRNTQT